ncbi:tyrosine-type recombinase/integrase [Falsirhodobacter sp. 20TX0035]|uniref:tyrosine-type recombinase/integrase n=1 Tax=Falsirhodobacter sp. 20TX0035 TaxID=3022019 RepID=UPI00232A9A52|nr:hypothetical protein [Falsirhodobacter sp. 20TX0035]MDB6455200.1 hypothetical protein [Falsirhodobacter sp. 20TX0035]
MKKGSKPYVQMKLSGGRLIPHYRLTWMQDGKRREKFIRLPEDMDSPEFDRAYWAIRSGASPVLAKPAKDTWKDLVTAYRGHTKFTRLAEGTRRSYDRVLNDIVEKNGSKSVSSLTRAHVRALHAKYAATPRKADWMVQVLSLLLNFAAKTLDWKVENVAEGIELHGKQREFEPWPEWMIAKLSEAPAIVSTAAELILGTGQRPNAAILMRHDHFRGEWMEVMDEKTDQRIEVFSPPSLRAHVAAVPKQGAFVLAKNLTEPKGYDTVEKAFRAWRKQLGERAKPYSLHGLRKLAIVRLAEAGCTDAQIQAITNQSPEMVAFYRQRASRKRLSKAAQMLVEQNKPKT